MKLYTIEWVNEIKKIECVYLHKRFMWNMTCRMKKSRCYWRTFDDKIKIRKDITDLTNE